MDGPRPLPHGARVLVVSGIARPRAVRGRDGGRRVRRGRRPGLRRPPSVCRGRCRPHGAAGPFDRRLDCAHDGEGLRPAASPAPVAVPSGRAPDERPRGAGRGFCRSGSAIVSHAAASGAHPRGGASARLSREKAREAPARARGRRRRPVRRARAARCDWCASWVRCSGWPSTRSTACIAASPRRIWRRRFRRRAPRTGRSSRARCSCTSAGCCWSC